MKIKFFLNSLTALVLIIAGANYALAVNFCSEAKTTAIYFVNGVWTDRDDAEVVRVLIEDAYSQELKNLYPSQIFEFKVAYNYHIDTVRDIIEVIGQKVAEINNPGVSKISPEVYLAMYTALKDIHSFIPFAAEPVVLTIEEAIAARITAEVNSSALIQKFESDLLEGQRDLLFAHSQGNMFAGDAMASLSGTYDGSIGMIGVASPAAFLYGSQSTYYTAHDDRIINMLRPLFSVLSSNVDNDPGLFNDPRDFSNHQFERSYFLKSLASRGLVDQDFYGKISSLVFPYTYLGSGAITVTLTWGSEPDVDLHVFEPNGAHVYYGNMMGSYGYLDLDDVTGYGPEHYYVSCGDIKPGTFKVGVNYYYGQNPEVAQIQINTSDGNTRTFTKNLPQSYGSAGNNSPLDVASVDVTLDSNGGYVYSVHQ